MLSGQRELFWPALGMNVALGDGRSARGTTLDLDREAFSKILHFAGPMLELLDVSRLDRNVCVPSAVLCDL